MGMLADAARAGGGKVIGVTPQLFIDQGYGDSHCDELIISPSMRDRKQTMEDRGDALIALPGGLGTLEEIFEVIVGRQLGYHDKPIVLLNIAGYYNPLLAMIEQGIDQHFIRAKSRLAFTVANNVSSAIDTLLHAKPAPPKPAISPTNSASE
jgi:uncharacterized protein (TIGR00730 family)